MFCARLEAERTLPVTLILQCKCKCCEPSRASYKPQPSSTREASACSRCWGIAMMEGKMTLRYSLWPALYFSR
jgi:hypothetical protein